MNSLRCHSIPFSGLLALILAALVTSTTGWAAQDQATYGFVRIIEGRADLMQASSSTLVELVTNYPLMVGDEIRVPLGSRVETLLPDGTYLRLDGDSELSFERLALSADSADQLSVLRLLRGETQLILPSDTPSSEAFRVDTLNASIYLQNKGTYRIRTNGTDWSEVVVREGFAEVVTEQGSSIVRSGEQSIVEGSASPLVRVERAGVRDELERWGDALLAEVDPADSRHVDPGLAYASAPLADNGHWVDVGGRSAWRPYVAAGWRPYHAGWWVHSPSGLTWVSTEPWGWVTYHYGGWDLAPGWGWVWYPGRVYTPASVFWYWGPTHVGWVPRPYYTHYYWPSYRPSWGIGFRHGVFGWAGGRPRHWAHWNFCQHRHFGRHRGPHVGHHDNYHRSGSQVSNMGALQEIPRGVIASDTRALTPDLWNRPTAAMNALTASRVDANGELPDVTPWVARSRQLPSQVEQAVMPRRRGGSLSTSPTRSVGGSMTARQATSGLQRERSSEGRQTIRRGASAPRTSASLSSSTARPTPSRRSVGSTSVTPTTGSRIDGETPAVADWRNRRTLSSGPSSRNQTPTARRVWDGVRSYRERSRQDTTTSVRPTHRAPGGGLGASPGYGSTPTRRSWTENPTSSRYFGGFGSSPGYGGSQSRSTRSRSTLSRPSASRTTYSGSGSSPGYGGSQRPGIRSRSGVSRPGGTTSTRGRTNGSSRSGGRSSSGGQSRNSAVARGSSSPPPN